MKLSVMIITYNHERFIAQALESVLAQRVNFDYEVVVGEDCSTDRTREILMDFHRRHPDKVVPLLRNHNLGGRGNLLGTLAACRGEYVALLEGDDFWIFKDKLQKQADFLDAHPDYALCCHRAQVLDEAGTWKYGSVFPSILAGTYTVQNLLEGNFIMTGSMVFRREAAGSLPDWFRKTSPPGDWPFCAIIATRGKIRFMDEAMSVYRVHSGGLWSIQTEPVRFRKVVRMLRVLDKHLEFRYTSTIRETISRGRRGIAEYHQRMASEARREGHRLKTLKHVAGCVRNGGLSIPGSRLTVASLAAYAVFGSWYRALGKGRRAISR